MGLLVIIDDQPDGAESVVHVEILVSRGAAIVLGQYLAVSIDICLFQRAMLHDICD